MRRISEDEKRVKTSSVDSGSSQNYGMSVVSRGAERPQVANIQKPSKGRRQE